MSKFLQQALAVSLFLCLLQPLAAQNLFSTIRVNAGGPATRDVEGQFWQADYGFTGGASDLKQKTISNTYAQVLYRYGRQGMSAYEFQVPPGDYVVSLKFSENSVTNIGGRVFHVTLNGQPFLQNFDILRETRDREFVAIDRAATVNTTGQIRIAFTPVAGQPLVNGIEIRPLAAAPPVAVALQPATVTLTNGQPFQFASKVLNTNNFGVLYSVEPALGTVSTNGYYVAPTTLEGPTTVTLIATAAADPSRRATTVINLVPKGVTGATLGSEVGVLATPWYAALGSGQSRTLYASVTGSSTRSVTWSISPAVGSISSTGVYRAPSVISKLTTVTVKATSAADTSKFDTMLILLKPPVSIDIAPAEASVAPGGRVDYTCTLIGTTDPKVIWSLSPNVGSIDENGVYTAPSSVSVSTKVTIRATSQEDAYYTDVAYVTVSPGTVAPPTATPTISLTISPSVLTLQAGKTQSFLVSVNGTSNTAVTWSLNPPVGTLSVSGLYTAPASLAAPTTVKVRATSVADPLAFTESTVNLIPAVTLSLTPTSVELAPGETQQFAATITGSTNTAVTWSLSAALGAISPTGLYTAPATLAGPTSVTLRATSVADPTKYRTATILLDPGIAVTVSPDPVTLTQGQSRQFTAAVSNTTNTSVIWTLSPAVGTLTAGGLYTAPATLTAPSTVIIKATSQADNTAFDTATINLAPAVTISLTPTSTTLVAGKTQQFTATVTGSTAPLTWTATAGTITSTGLYTAPASVATATPVTIKAALSTDPTKSATAAVTVNPAVTISLTSSQTTLEASQTASLTATVTGSTNTGVVWSLNPGTLGTLSTNGNTAVYTAPATNTTQQTVEVVATSMADNTKLAKVILTLLPTISVTVTPTLVELAAGQTQQFNAGIVGASNTAVVWSINPPVGTISDAGLYVAPASVSNSQTVQVVATSAAAATKSATATVKLGTTVQFSLNEQGLTSLSFKGVSYLYPGSGVFSLPGQTPTSRSLDNATKTLTLKYAWGSATCGYTATGNRITLTIVIRNTSATALNEIQIFPVGIQLPSKPQEYDGDTPMRRWTIGEPAFLPFTHQNGIVVWANDEPSLPLGLVAPWAENRPTSTQFQLRLQTGDMARIYGTTEWPMIRRPIPPGSSDRYVMSLRFGDENHTIDDLTKDVFELFRTALPIEINWPDRRPIASVFLSSFSNPNFARNPRGWFGDANLDVNTSTGVSAFHARLLATADATIAEANRVGAQGIIIWDIEGQEYLHNASYVGDPSQAISLAPELAGVIDTFISKFHSAGLRVGFTLRPQHFTRTTGVVNTSGSIVSLVSGDTFDPSMANQAIQIGGAVYYIASITSPTQLTLKTPAGTMTSKAYGIPKQSIVDDVANELSNKIRYARERWGASLFYVDSVGDPYKETSRSSVFKQILNQYNNEILFIPEQYSTGHYAYGSAYLELRHNQTQTQPHSLKAYPNAFSVINVADSDLSTNFLQLVESVRRGNILLFQGWYRNATNDLVKQIYAAAH